MTTSQKAFGVYRRVAAAQTKNQLIREIAQNGGAVTTLLVYSLENKIIDGAIVSTIDKKRPFYPTPKLATTSQEILESAGTRYTYSPNTQALSEVTRQKRRAVAFVGTPCQIRAIRKMQQAKLERVQPIKLLIGLMCSKTYTYKQLMIDHIQNKLGISLHSIKRIEIRNGMIIRQADAKETKIPLAAIEKYARKSCRLCNDFSSELADISAGSLGLHDWTLIIVRTQVGDQIFNQAEKAQAFAVRSIREDEPAFKLLHRLAEVKHSRAENS